jgi:hypothetical protein
VALGSTDGQFLREPPNDVLQKLERIADHFRSGANGRSETRDSAWKYSRTTVSSAICAWRIVVR